MFFTFNYAFVDSIRQAENKLKRPNIAILLARLDSVRLPGKHLALIGADPMITHVYRRLRQGGNYKVILATSDRDVDKPLLDWALSQGIDAFAGDAFDLRKRVVDCVNQYEAPFFARVNADSPFVDHRLLELGFSHLESSNDDVFTNLFPRSFPYGYSVEVFRAACFIASRFDNIEKENITSYFYSNPEKFKIYNLSSGYSNLSDLRMTVDKPQDLQVLAELFKAHLNIFSYSLEQLVPLFQNLKAC